MIQATQLRVGMTILHNGELCKVLKIDHLTQGNKRGKVQAELRIIKTGIKTEYRFRSEDSIERAVFQTREMEYLYEERGIYYFMDMESYEQLHVDRETLGDSVYYLEPNAKILVDMYDGLAVGLELPSSVNLKVVDTDPPFKGATAASSYKPAKLENGLIVKVPPFVKTGDVVKVATESSEYVERV